MNLKEKMPVVEQAVRSISRHDDEDMAVRDHYLREIEALIVAERNAMAARVEQRLLELRS